MLPALQLHHFRPELLPPPQPFYAAELGELCRPDRNGWTKPKAGCPFHPSKSKTSFRVNLQHGGFHCFACQSRGGGLIDFVKLRHGFDFKEACIYLGCWREELLSNDECRRIDDRAAKSREARERAVRLEEMNRSRRLELRDEIHCLSQIQQEMTSRLSELRQGASPLCDDEEERRWRVLALAHDDLRMAEAEYMELSGLEHEG